MTDEINVTIADAQPISVTVTDAQPINVTLTTGSSTGAVTSVFGRTGAVVATTNDYTWAQIDKTTSDIADITTKSHTSLTDIGTNTHSQIDTHIADNTIHFTEASIDHTAITNIGSNSHDDIDGHISDVSIHFLESSINHNNIQNIGSNTHAQIDTHIASTSNPHSVTKSQVGLGNVTNDEQVKVAGDTMDGAFIQKVVTLTDGATPALDASLGNVFDLTAAGDRTIAIPTNPTEGQKIVIRHRASGAARTLSLNTGTGGFQFSSLVTSIPETAQDELQHIGCMYDSTLNKWIVLAENTSA